MIKNLVDIESARRVTAEGRMFVVAMREDQNPRAASTGTALVTFCTVGSACYRPRAGNGTLEKFNKKIMNNSAESRTR